jgi:hypothetical protein
VYTAINQDCQMDQGNISLVSGLHLFLFRLMALLSRENPAIALDSFVIKQIMKHEKNGPKGGTRPLF